MEKIEPPAQLYRLSEDQKQTEFLFKKVHEGIAELEAMPEHKWILEILYTISNQCWLDAQDKEATSAASALRDYIETLKRLPLEAKTAVTKNLQELAQLREEIEQLAVTEDQDDEEAIPAASPDSIARTLVFVERMRQFITSQGTALHLPSVFATRDRSVQLFWKIDRRQTLLLFRPGKQTVEVGIKKPDELSSRKEVSIEEALVYAQRAMRNK